MIRDILGAHVRFEPISVNHPLYHCFFDFDDGPPLGSELRSGVNVLTPFPKLVHFLEGVMYKGRMVAIYSDKGYIVKWSDMMQNEPQLKIGVNMVIFSLIQKGGIASNQ